MQCVCVDGGVQELLDDIEKALLVIVSIYS
jgi:hypothetical protein